MTDAPLTIIADDRAFATTATVEGVTLTEHDIRSHELDRARRALAYLKVKVGDDAMRRLLAGDVGGEPVDTGTPEAAHASDVPEAGL